MKKTKLKHLFLAILGTWMAGSAMALDQVNGVYQIGTAQDLADFADIVNESRQYNLHAVLTADIDFREYSKMIGAEGKPYNGTFDGQGHTITIAYNLNEERVALFRRVNGGTIQNLIVMGTITTNSKLASGIVGGIWQSGHINNCVSYVTITDDSQLNNNEPTDATHAGICGSFEDNSASDNITITNCAFLGKIDAPNRKGSGGIVGYTNGGTISNCYVGGILNLATGQDNNIICRNNATVSNCYYTDLQGMNGHGDASPKALNELQSALGSGWSEIYNGAAPLPSVFVPTINNNYYELSTASHMRQFAELVNNSNSNVNAKMMNDISLSNIWTPIGNNDHRYAGIFDGQFHVINSLTIDLSQENVGIFGVVQSCTIQNLISGSNNSIKGTKGVGGIIGKGDSGGSNGITLTNVGNESSVTATSQDAGGLIGYINHLTQDVTITNCYNTGSIKAGNDTNNHEAAAIAGWLGNKTVIIKGFWNTGSITGSEYSKALWRNGSSETLERIYNKDNTDNGATQFTDAQLSNGELCYLLNNSKSINNEFYQTLGKDNHPVLYPDHGIVYSKNNNYANYLTNENNYYELADAQDVNWFAEYVNAGHPDINAELIYDIDFGDNNSTAFTPIGTDTYKYGGTFDGQRHKISNMIIDAGIKEQGLFGVCHGGVHIKNLTIDKSCKIINAGNKSCISALIGCVNTNNGEQPGDVTIENVGNEMNLEVGTGGNAADCGALLGHDYSSNLNVKIINCYNTGNVTGWESAAFTGWTPRVMVVNSWNMGRVKSYQNYNYGGSNSLVRGNANVTITNSYDLNIYNDTNEDITDVAENQSRNWRPNRDTNSGYPSADYSNECLSNGKLFASLFAYNDNGVDGSVWRMYFDADDATKSHPVLNGDAIAMREDCQNRMVAGTYDVKLYRTVKAGAWNTFCAPFAVPTSQFEKVVVLDTNNQDTDVLHFVTVSGNNTEAGKAYLVKTDSEITSMTLDNVTVSPTITPSTAGGYDFTGVYSPTSLPQDAYVFTTRKLDNTDVIIKVNAGTNMNGFRAYLKATSSSPARSFVIDDEITGIITIDGEVIENGKMYNLGGQRVNKPQRGLYIQNGKKVIR